MHYEIKRGKEVEREREREGGGREREREREREGGGREGGRKREGGRRHVLIMHYVCCPSLTLASLGAMALSKPRLEIVEQPKSVSKLFEFG